MLFVAGIPSTARRLVWIPYTLSPRVFTKQVNKVGSPRRIAAVALPPAKPLVTESPKRDNGTRRESSPVKYRQPGYQDRSQEPRQKPAVKPSRKDSSFGPRPLQMPGTREVSRCSQCGALIEGIADSAEKCPKCGFELHSCKQCAYFDPSRRFECSQPIPQRIPRKDAQNDCTFYAMRVMVEKETSTPGAKVLDARQAFENLFKK
jgi:predicted RNA-binding Zn-ribbon protein involved in translation (DUF1610 family)